MLGLIVLCLVLSVFLSVLGSTIPWMPTQCGSLGWLGLPCPLCGLTRGFASILIGDLATAQRWNPASLLLFAWLMLEVVCRLVALCIRDWKGRLSEIIRRDVKIHKALAGLYLGYVVYFYLSGAPSEWI
ncbi:MAG: DUF2752 domain-containing protein [Verrucomicrobia bacterium]|nr:DUF2752 domain-containing protein [Verrucomicrobiota bacterium]